MELQSDCISLIYILIFREAQKIHSHSTLPVLEPGTSEDSKGKKINECSNDEETDSDTESSELSAVKKHDT